MLGHVKHLEPIAESVNGLFEVAFGFILVYTEAIEIGVELIGRDEMGHAVKLECHLGDTATVVLNETGAVLSEGSLFNKLMIVSFELWHGVAGLLHQRVEVVLFEAHNFLDLKMNFKAE